MKHPAAAPAPAVPPTGANVRAPTALDRFLVRRAVARIALAVLTVGLAGLGLVAVDDSNRVAQTSDHIRALAAVSDAWDQFFLQVGVEDEALGDYLRGGPVEGSSPLRSAIGGARPSLRWLETYGTAADVSRARNVEQSYDAYTASLQEVLVSYGHRSQVTTALVIEQAALSVAALREQSAARAAEARNELGRYLLEVDQDNKVAQLGATVIGIIDVVLLAGCALILLSYQRRAERQAANSAFRASHDELTGLPNRTFLFDRMREAMAPDSGRDGRLALLLLDLDGFKDINDGLGHPVGDALLKEIAGRLWVFGLDSSATVSRLGGDEFAIMLVDSSLADGVAVAEAILSAVRQPVVLNGLTTQVGGSIGVAVHPGHASTAAELLKSADIAMYDAKRRRAGVAVFSAQEHDQPADRLVVLSQLRRAVADSEQVVLHYQPKVHTELGSVCGVEALVRWQHPTRGLLPPSEFMGAAERSDLITSLTYRILTIGFTQLAQWLDEGLVLPMSLNIGAAALIDTAFPNRVAELLAEHAVPPGMITLEITETALIADDVSTTKAMARLQDLGVRLSLDDFGTGYSSLSHLTMPLQELKIDQQFVTDMTVSPQSHAIARAVVDVAHALGLGVVGEGVEDADTLEALRMLGCDEVQGYHLCRPIPEPQLRVWLRDRLHSPHQNMI